MSLVARFQPCFHILNVLGCGCGAGLQRRESIGLGGEEASVLGDAHHGKDLGEVGR